MPRPRPLVSLALVAALLTGCDLPESCPQTPTPCPSTDVVEISLGKPAGLDGPLEAYRLTITLTDDVGDAGAAGAAGQAGASAATQRCLFATPLNQIQCEPGPFYGSLTPTTRAGCSTSDPSLLPGEDGGVVIDPGETSCYAETTDLVLRLSKTAQAKGFRARLVLERGDLTFAPVDVVSAEVTTRPDGPKCGNTCVQNAAFYDVVDLTRPVE